MMTKLNEPRPGQLFPDLIQKGAAFSECRTWRYFLYRIWKETAPRLAAIGLNPSTADENYDDNTVKRLVRFAQRWGFGGLYLLNLFAFRATDPKRMLMAFDPVGPENDTHLLTYVLDADATLACWGGDGSFRDRDRAVLKLIGEVRPVECLGVTKDGHPKHLLRLSRSTKRVPYEGRTR